MVPPNLNVLTFPPLTGGCSERLFRFFFKKPIAKVCPGDVEIDNFLSFFFKHFWGQLFILLSVWGMLRSFIRCVRSNNDTSPNYNKTNLQTYVDGEMHRLPPELTIDGSLDQRRHCGVL